jgi:hypothetical protein
MTARRNWQRARQAAKPHEPPNIQFPQDALGQRAKAAWQQWRQSLTPQQQKRRKQAAPLR